MTLHIDAELALEGESAFDVWTEGDTVVVNAPSLWSLQELRSLVAALPGEPLGASLPPMEIRVRRATVARTAEGSGALAGPAGVEVTPDWRGVLVAAVRALG